MITLSIIKADTGGYVGHSSGHPDMIDVAQKALDRARDELSLMARSPTAVTTSR